MSHIDDKGMPARAVDAPVSSTRRKLGLSLGAGVAMTLTGRSALAAECLSPSAFASASHLSHHGTPPNCTGNTRATWASIPVGQLPANPVFHSVFPVNNAVSWGQQSKLSDVLQHADNGNTAPMANPISAEFAAAYLNIITGAIPMQVLTTIDLLNIWNGWTIQGFYSPRTGIQWFADDIVAYLQSVNQP